jgi:hypothetical protein
MAEKIAVREVFKEHTHVGAVRFPAAVPEGLIDRLRFPDDIFEQAAAMGLTDRTVKFLLAALHGRWAVGVPLDLQEIAIHTGMQYAEMDAIVRDLIAKNYARLDQRLDLYRFWIVLLHVKGVRFVED